MRLALISFLMIPVATGCGGGEEEAKGFDRIEGTETGDCSDGADNDLDGVIDCDEAECAGSTDCAEADADADADAEPMPISLRIQNTETIIARSTGTTRPHRCVSAHAPSSSMSESRKRQGWALVRRLWVPLR